MKGDIMGQILAMSSLLPVCLGVSFVTLIIFRRDLHTISFLTGLVLDEAFNWVLKHLIQEGRPKRDRSNLYTEYGMPSSHSQFMWFFATYMTFFIWIRVYRNYSILDDLWKVVVCVGSFFVASVVAYSRIYLEYHTAAQVVWGGVVGVVAGSLWFAFVQLVLTPLFPHLASSPVGEFLMLRDSTLIPHVLWFEYTSSRSEARSRQRKIISRKSQ
ncbi:dolichyldiphosphatase 1-like [Babylonia areolata]|uniref:dolichyldiphosphatase 1-like n=1 Tax=Babylonia areolata TaxID=304850 RepID=UPI003FD3E00A